MPGRSIPCPAWSDVLQQLQFARQPVPFTPRRFPRPRFILERANTKSYGASLAPEEEGSQGLRGIQESQGGESFGSATLWRGSCGWDQWEGQRGHAVAPAGLGGGLAIPE